ncbi:septal ring lytic transglycosylase RlpA family protein [Ferrimonas pelagia]|uniref:Endolytic peptidoglycan transglycosylase RlpA n=1 Tax=Ferrimonas pelagia TaxID=1177826 RepID=A0ABP9FHR1_9GAMM
MSRTFHRWVKLLFCLMLSFGFTGCSSMSSGAQSGAVGYSQTGIASFYADKYQGRLTANGERFDQNGDTAAHKTLPFGTRVRVTNVATGQSVVVRINDRGPFVRGRIIDLTRKNFGQLGLHSAGLIKVRIEVVK